MSTPEDDSLSKLISSVSSIVKPVAERAQEENKDLSPTDLARLLVDQYITPEFIQKLEQDVEISPSLQERMQQINSWDLSKYLIPKENPENQV